MLNICQKCQKNTESVLWRSPVAWEIMQSIWLLGMFYNTLFAMFGRNFGSFVGGSNVRKKFKKLQYFVLLTFLYPRNPVLKDHFITFHYLYMYIMYNYCRWRSFKRHQIIIGPNTKDLLLCEKRCWKKDKLSCLKKFPLNFTLVFPQ